MDQKMIWIAVVAVVVIVVAVLFLKKKKPTTSSVNLEKLFHALGGKDNMVSSEASGSKVVFILKDTKLMIQEELKALGASGIVVSKDKATIIFGKSSELLVEEIKQSL